MAKLSARNRSIVWRFRKDYNADDLAKRQAKYNAKNNTDFTNSWVKEFREYILCSDNILLSHIVTWHKDGKRNDNGYKRVKKLNDTEKEAMLAWLKKHNFNQVL